MIEKKKSAFRTTLNEPGKKELIEKGKESFPRPEPNSNSVNPEVSNAFMQASGDIVDGLTLVIGALEEQTEEQKENQKNNKLMMSILQEELTQSRSDTRSTRRIIWAGVSLIAVTIAISTKNILDVQESYRNQKSDMEKMESILSRSYGISIQNGKYVGQIVKSLNSKPTFMVLQDNNGVKLRVIQQIERENSQGRMEKIYDTIDIPLRIRGATLGEPLVKTEPDPIGLPPVEKEILEKFKNKMDINHLPEEKKK